MLIQRKSKVIIQIITYVMVFSFIFEQYAWAQGQVQLPVVSCNSIESLIDVNLQKIDLQGFDIPEQFGKVKEVWEPDAETEIVREQRLSKNNKTIIHIQDSHANYQAQMNVAKILECLSSRQSSDISHKVSDFNRQPKIFIAVEGAKGKVDTSILNNIENENVRYMLSDYLMKNGLMDGAEFYQTMQKKENRDNFLIWGIEDKDIYLKNRDAFKELYKLKPSAEKVIKKTEKKINTIANKIFSPEQKEFVAKMKAYHMDEIGLEEYITVISRQSSVVSKKKNELTTYGLPLISYNLRLMTNLINLKKHINFSNIESDRMRLIKDIQKICTKEEMKDVIMKGLYYQIGKISAKDYFNYLEMYIERIKENKEEQSRNWKNTGTLPQDNSYNNLFVYIDYVNMESQINRNDLFKELAETEEQMADFLFNTDELKKYYVQLKNVNILHKFLELKIYREDLRYYKEHKNDFISVVSRQSPVVSKEQETLLLTSFLTAFEKFCDLGIQRDSILVENTIKKMEELNAETCILFTGGFHTEGMMDLLREKNISYAVVSPKVIENIAKDRYVDLMLENKSVLDKVLAFTGTRLKPAGPFNELGSELKAEVESFIQSATDPLNFFEKLRSASKTELKKFETVLKGENYKKYSAIIAPKGTLEGIEGKRFEFHHPETNQVLEMVVSDKHIEEAICKNMQIETKSIIPFILINSLGLWFGLSGAGHAGQGMLFFNSMGWLDLLGLGVFLSGFAILYYFYKQINNGNVSNHTKRWIIDITSVVVLFLIAFSSSSLVIGGIVIGLIVFAYKIIKHIMARLRDYKDTVVQKTNKEKIIPDAIPEPRKDVRYDSKGRIVKDISRDKPSKGINTIFSFTLIMTFALNMLFPAFVNAGTCQGMLFGDGYILPIIVVVLALISWDVSQIKIKLWIARLMHKCFAMILISLSLLNVGFTQIQDIINTKQTVEYFDNWINRVRNDRTGLPPSHIGDTTPVAIQHGFATGGFTYDEAQLALRYVRTGKYAEAKKIIFYFVDRYNKYSLEELMDMKDVNNVYGILRILPSLDGKWHKFIINCVDVSSPWEQGNGIIEWYVDGGPQAWLLMTTAQLLMLDNSLTGSQRSSLEAFLKELADAMISLFNDEYIVSAGPKLQKTNSLEYDREKKGHIENMWGHYAFLRQLAYYFESKCKHSDLVKKYREKAESILAGLKNKKAWIKHGDEAYFWQGFEYGHINQQIPTDVQTWGIASVGPKKINDVFGAGTAEGILNWLIKHVLVLVDYEKPDGTTVTTIGADFSDPHLSDIVKERGGVIAPITDEWTAGQIYGAMIVMADYYYENRDTGKAEEILAMADALKWFSYVRAIQAKDGMLYWEYATKYGLPTGYGWKTPNAPGGSLAGNQVLFAMLGINPFDVKGTSTDSVAKINKLGIEKGIELLLGKMNKGNKFSKKFLLRPGETARRTGESRIPFDIKSSASDIVKLNDPSVFKKVSFYSEIGENVGKVESTKDRIGIQTANGSSWNSAELSFTRDMNFSKTPVLKLKLKAANGAQTLRVNIVDKNYIVAQNWGSAPPYVDVAVVGDNKWHEYTINIADSRADIIGVNAISFEVGVSNLNNRSGAIFTIDTGSSMLTQAGSGRQKVDSQLQETEIKNSPEINKEEPQESRKEESYQPIEATKAVSLSGRRGTWGGSNDFADYMDFDPSKSFNSDDVLRINFSSSFAGKEIIVQLLPSYANYGDATNIVTKTIPSNGILDVKVNEFGTYADIKQFSIHSGPRAWSGTNSKMVNYTSAEIIGKDVKADKKNLLKKKTKSSSTIKALIPFILPSILFLPNIANAGHGEFAGDLFMQGTRWVTDSSWGILSDMAVENIIMAITKAVSVFFGAALGMGALIVLAVSVVGYIKSKTGKKFNWNKIIKFVGVLAIVFPLYGFSICSREGLYLVFAIMIFIVCFALNAQASEPKEKSIYKKSKRKFSRIRVLRKINTVLSRLRLKKGQSYMPAKIEIAEKIGFGLGVKGLNRFTNWLFQQGLKFVDIIKGRVDLLEGFNNMPHEVFPVDEILSAEVFNFIDMKIEASQLSREEKNIINILASLKQWQVFNEWEDKGIDDLGKRQELSGYINIDKEYPGGLVAFISEKDFAGKRKKTIREDYFTLKNISTDSIKDAVEVIKKEKGSEYIPNMAEVADKLKVSSNLLSEWFILHPEPDVEFFGIKKWKRNYESVDKSYLVKIKKAIVTIKAKEGENYIPFEAEVAKEMGITRQALSAWLIRRGIDPVSLGMRKGKKVYGNLALIFFMMLGASGLNYGFSGIDNIDFSEILSCMAILINGGLLLLGIANNLPSAGNKASISEARVKARKPIDIKKVLLSILLLTIPFLYGFSAGNLILIEIGVLLFLGVFFGGYLVYKYLFSRGVFFGHSVNQARSAEQNIKDLFDNLKREPDMKTKALLAARLLVLSMQADVYEAIYKEYLGEEYKKILNAYVLIGEYAKAGDELLLVDTTKTIIRDLSSAADIPLREGLHDRDGNIRKNCATNLLMLLNQSTGRPYKKTDQTYRKILRAYIYIGNDTWGSDLKSLESIPALLSAGRDNSANVRAKAAVMLNYLDENDLKKLNYEQINSIVEILGSAGQKKAVNPLVKILIDSNDLSDSFYSHIMLYRKSIDAINDILKRAGISDLDDNNLNKGIINSFQRLKYIVSHKFKNDGVVIDLENRPADSDTTVNILKIIVKELELYQALLKNRNILSAVKKKSYLHLILIFSLGLLLGLPEIANAGHGVLFEFNRFSSDDWLGFFTSVVVFILAFITKDDSAEQKNKSTATDVVSPDAILSKVKRGIILGYEKANKNPFGDYGFGEGEMTSGYLNFLPNEVVVGTFGMNEIEVLEEDSDIQVLAIVSKNKISKLYQQGTGEELTKYELEFLRSYLLDRYRAKYFGRVGEIRSLKPIIFDSAVLKEKEDVVRAAVSIWKRCGIAGEIIPIFVQTDKYHDIAGILESYDISNIGECIIPYDKIAGSGEQVDSIKVVEYVQEKISVFLNSRREDQDIGYILENSYILTTERNHSIWKQMAKFTAILIVRESVLGSAAFMGNASVSAVQELIQIYPLLAKENGQTESNKDVLNSLWAELEKQGFRREDIERLQQQSQGIDQRRRPEESANAPDQMGKIEKDVRQQL
jgi:hypothetical protein